MNKLIIMSGVAGSGKSTWAENYVKEHLDTTIVSTDAVRYELYGKYLLTKEQEKIARQTMDNRIKNLGKMNKNVIFDIAVIKNKNKIKLYNKYKNYFNQIELVIIDTPLEECLKRNNQRDRHVPEEVIKEMYSYREPISEEIKNKFHSIIEIKQK